MRLIQRPQITTLALPRSHTWPSDLLPPHQAPFYFLPDVYNFAKFMLATPTYLISDLTRDLDELASERRILAGMGDDLGISFVDGAEARVRQQITKAAALDTVTLKEKIEKTIRDQGELEERVAFHERRRKNQELVPQEEIPIDLLAIKSSGIRIPTPNALSESQEISASQESFPRSTAEQPRHHHRQRRNLNPPPPTTQTYYYYQAASGLPIYLHPLDIRILLSYFSSYSAFPDHITIRVEAFSESTIDENLRKRCKYLAHMPEGADVVFVEADLEGVVGAEVLKNFEGLLKSRISRRKEKGKKDDKAKAKAEERERKREKLWTASAAYPTPHSRAITTEEPVDSISSLMTLDTGASPSISPSPPHQPQQTTGAWGARSFASALHSPPINTPNRGQQKEGVNAEDEWDIDIAWHELERKSGGKKRGAKLVVLGGGGGRRR